MVTAAIYTHRHPRFLPPSFLSVFLGSLSYWCYFCVRLVLDSAVDVCQILPVPVDSRYKNVCFSTLTARELGLDKHPGSNVRN